VPTAQADAACQVSWLSEIILDFLEVRSATPLLPECAAQRPGLRAHLMLICCLCSRAVPWHACASLTWGACPSVRSRDAWLRKDQ